MKNGYILFDVRFGFEEKKFLKINFRIYREIKLCIEFDGICLYFQ